jgi:glycosyltransferase involved in cell wall biosynthesis
MFVEALNQIGNVSALFFVSKGCDLSTEAQRRYRKILREQWNIINASLVERYERPSYSNWNLYYSGIFGLSRQLRYGELAGTSHAQAIKQCLLDWKIDAIFAHRLDITVPLLRSTADLPPVYFDLDDIEHIKFIRDIHQPPKWIGKLQFYAQVPAIIVGERKAACFAKKTFVCSDVDKRYLTRILHFPKVITIPNAVPIPILRAVTNEQTLLFLGHLAYAPNSIGADFLVQNIWPIIYREMPNARLIIAGDKAEYTISYHQPTSGVEFIGFVDDLDEIYQRTRVVCCPLLSGGGTRIKILEAAGYGKPVVSTTIGAEGLEFKNNIEILLRDSAEEFAKACINLLKDKSICEQLGRTARAAVIEKYDRKTIIKNIIKHLVC